MKRPHEVTKALGLPCRNAETTPHGCGHAPLRTGPAAANTTSISTADVYPPRYVETMVEAFLRRKGRQQPSVHCGATLCSPTRRTLGHQAGSTDGYGITPGSNRFRHPELMRRLVFRLQHLPGPTKSRHPHRHYPRRGRIVGTRSPNPAARIGLINARHAPWLGCG